MKVDLSKYPSGPRNEFQVLEAALTLNNEFIQNLKDSQLQTLSIPGIFLDISSKQFDNEVFSQIRNWCNALLNRVFLSCQVAIIVKITIHLDDIDSILRDIETNLIDIIGQVPIDLMHLNRQSFLLKEITKRKNKFNNRLAPKTKSTGLCWKYQF